MAFGLLGLGAVLILVGILSSIKNHAGNDELLANKKKNQAEQSIFLDYHDEITQTNKDSTPDSKKEPLTIKKINKNTSNNLKYNISDKPETEKNQTTTVSVRNLNERAVLCLEDAILYIDKSSYNTYEKTKLNSLLLDTGNIHRIGSGQLSFDGYNFKFDSEKTHENYNLKEIEFLNFYPNCITITRKKNGATSIFFIDTTLRLKAAFDANRMAYASQ